jgi:hypothetical protein
MPKTRRRLSEAERAERRRRDGERLRRAAEQLLTSEGWYRWVPRALAGRASTSSSSRSGPGRDIRRRLQELAAARFGVKEGERAIAIIAVVPVRVGAHRRWRPLDQRQPCQVALHRLDGRRSEPITVHDSALPARAPAAP